MLVVFSINKNVHFFYLDRCGVGEYVCNNGHCIESRQRCDGRSHCPNGEDEADCPGI